jgi:hypothetical protein
VLSIPAIENFGISSIGKFNCVDSIPLRVVIDGKNQITDTTLKIFSNAANTKIFNSGNTQHNNAGKLDLHHVLEQLAQQTDAMEVFPSILMAILQVTKGSPVSMRLIKPRLSSLDSSLSKPVLTTIPLIVCHCVLLLMAKTK